MIKTSGTLFLQRLLRVMGFVAFIVIFIGFSMMTNLGGDDHEEPTQFEKEAGWLCFAYFGPAILALCVPFLILYSMRLKMDKEAYLKGKRPDNPTVPTWLGHKPDTPNKVILSFCPHCGENVEGAAAFCPHCGRKL